MRIATVKPCIRFLVLESKIQVLAVKETDAAVVIEAKLVAPEAEEVISTSPSYPYMILKMTNVEKDVQFLLH